MNIDLLPIINNEGQKIEFDGEIKLSVNDCVAVCNMHGTAFNFAGRLEVSINVNAVINSVCGRCLKPLSVPLKFEINETVGKNDLTLDGTILNVSALVTDEVTVELPIRYLCDTECKGLCSICGTNLNINKCNCEDNDIDDRFAALKDLLK